MESVDEDTYLGDVISGDGKNTKNINKRISKGLGIISSVTNLLDKICLGAFYFEVAVLLRESMFLNGILTNAEVWHNVKKGEIEELEELDRSLLRKILQVPATTPKEALYLELGILPISVVIKVRRCMYLHYLLNLDKSEMLYKFFITQWNNPTKGDWAELVKEDLNDLKIKKDFEDIRHQSKLSFAKLVKKRAQENAFEDLSQMKDGHSKMKNVQYPEIKMQNYMKSYDIKTKEALNLFKFRTRMAEFGENYRAGDDPIMCPLCCEDLDNQSHSFQCKLILKEIEIKGKITEVYSSDISKEMATTITKIVNIRKKLLLKE